MIVNDLNLPCRTLDPAEANPPLIIDTDAPLAFAISLERFEAILRRNPQFLNPNDPIQDRQFAHDDRFNVRETRDPPAFEQRSRVLAAERSDRHRVILTYPVSIVNRPYREFPDCIPWP